MCWFHVVFNIKRVIDALPDTFRNAINSDLRFLQASHDDSIFNLAVRLFFEKYQQFSEVGNFLERFKKSWVAKNNYWYKVAALLYPSTNNAVEGFNRNIKENIFGGNN